MNMNDYEKQMKKIDKMNLDKIKPLSAGHKKDIEFMKRVQSKRLAKKMGLARTFNPFAAFIGGILTPKPAGAGSDFTPEQIKAMLDKKK